MLVRHYTDKHNFDYVVKDLGNYVFVTDDMDKEVICASCGKKFKFGDAYTSKEWFTASGIWGLWVCGDCYEKEWERIRAAQKEEDDEE